MQDKNLSEITYVRLSHDQKTALERIAANHNLTQRLSDHIRFAIDQYVAGAETASQPAAGQQPATQPA